MGKELKVSQAFPLYLGGINRSYTFQIVLVGSASLLQGNHE